jgi:hypothetical protein
LRANDRAVRARPGAAAVPQTGRAGRESRILLRVESPGTEREELYYEEQEVLVRPGGGFWALGGRLTWVAALVLALSSFTDWYAEHGLAGPTIAVIGWHTGALGKLVFFIGLVLLARDDLRPDPPDLDPGHDPGRRARDRHLDQPSGVTGRDRGRPLASIRRAIATSTPKTAPPRTSSGQCTPS